MRRNKLVKFFIVTAAAAVLGGCAKSPPSPDKEITPEDLKRTRDIFLTVELDILPKYNSSAEFQKKALGGWRDFLNLLKSDRYIETPLNIALSGNVIKFLRNIERDNIELSPLITYDLQDLNKEQRGYLIDKYNLDSGTTSILRGQIMEAASYIGKSITESGKYGHILQTETYSKEVKDNLVNIIKIELNNFNRLLKETLERENIGEAATSLSNAYLALLTPERVKVQVLEGLVAYKRWSGDFPSGFVPKGGHITQRAAEELEKTSIEWALVQSTRNIRTDSVQTAPQLIYTEPESFKVKNSDETCQSRGSKNVISLIRTPKSAANLLENTGNQYINFEKLKNIIYKVNFSTRTVSLNEAQLDLGSFELKDEFQKIKDYLQSASENLVTYRNSGQATLKNILYIQEKLLIAEAGILADNITKKEYDRVLRRSLIEIYRKIGIPTPVKYFFPVPAATAVEPKEELTLKTDVECDGNVEQQEWEGAYRVSYSSEPVKDFYAAFNDQNLYFRIDLATHTVNEISVIGGHINAESAALYPRRLSAELDNIQDFPISTEVVWRREVPLKTVIYRASGEEEWETLTGNYNVGYSSRVIEVTLPLRYLGVRSNKKIYMKVVADGKVLPAEKHMEITAPELYSSRSIISNIDTALDNYGPGNYAVNKGYGEYSANTDFRKIDIDQRSGEKIISLQFSSIDNPENAPFGFGKARIDLYIDINNQRGLGNTSLLPGRNAYVQPDDAWEYAVTVSGHDKAVYNTAQDKIGEPEVSVNLVNNTVNIFID
ncbi:MAG: glucodextranase DOMON-like domain-containing protein, partial [Elusimicrobiota bacterium]|nr:glucodextranase DOMON-like domain-containing protein [Elusimicrobiota bacterium]